METAEWRIKDFIMRDISLEELLEAGCHFGHQVTRQNPKARDFVFEARDNIHIIDLAKTKEGLDAASEFVRELAAKGGSLLVVGTKRQAQNLVEEEVKRGLEKTHGADRPEGEEGIFYVTNRWMGGTLTNFSEMSKNYKKLKDLAKNLQDEDYKTQYTKREIGMWIKDLLKLKSFYGGVVSMKRLPDALFIVDTHLEDLAVKEANAMGVKTLGIVDTNADPLVIDYPIPANDDALGSLKLIITHIIDAWIEGRTQGAEAESGIKNQESSDPGKETPKKSVKEKIVKKTTTKKKSAKIKKSSGSEKMSSRT